MTNIVMVYFMTLNYLRYFFKLQRRSYLVQMQIASMVRIAGRNMPAGPLSQDLMLSQVDVSLPECS